VLSTNYRFSGPHDFPGEEVQFELAADFDGMDRKPAAYLLLDVTWIGMLAISAGAYPARVLRHETVYACPVQHCLSMRQFYALAQCWQRNLYTQGA
jgi:hypothetical protein